MCGMVRIPIYLIEASMVYFRLFDFWWGCQVALFIIFSIFFVWLTYSCLFVRVFIYLWIFFVTNENKLDTIWLNYSILFREKFITVIYCFSDIIWKYFRALTLVVGYTRTNDKIRWSELNKMAKKSLTISFSDIIWWKYFRASTLVVRYTTKNY